MDVRMPFMNNALENVFQSEEVNSTTDTNSLTEGAEEALSSVDFQEILEYLNDSEQFSQGLENFGSMNDVSANVKTPAFAQDDLILPDYLEFILADDLSTAPSLGYESNDGLSFLEAGEGGGYFVPVQDLIEDLVADNATTDTSSLTEGAEEALSSVDFQEILEYLNDPEKFSQGLENFGWLNDDITNINTPTFAQDDLILPDYLEFILADDLSTAPSLVNSESLGLFEIGGTGYVVPVQDSVEGVVDNLSEIFPSPPVLRPEINISTSRPGAWFDPHNGTILPPGQFGVSEIYLAPIDTGYIPEGIQALPINEETVAIPLDPSDYVEDAFLANQNDVNAIFETEQVEVDPDSILALAEEAAEHIEEAVDAAVDYVNQAAEALDAGAELTPQQIQTLNEALVVRDQTAAVISRLDVEGFDTTDLTERLIEPLDTALGNAGVSRMSSFEIEAAEAGLQNNGELSAVLEKGSSSIERGFKVAGKAMLVVGLAASGYHIITADNPAEAAAGEAGGWAGAFAAASAAESFVAPLVAAAGPFGWAIGAFVGLTAGAAGYWAGSMAGKATYYHFSGSDSKDVADDALQVALLELASLENIDAKTTFLRRGIGSIS